MPERTYRRERLEQPLRITAAADARRLSRRWAGAEQRDIQLHYHRAARAWLERRARRAGQAPIRGTDYTSVHADPLAPRRPGRAHDPLWGELTGRVRIDVWTAEDGQPAEPALEELWPDPRLPIGIRIRARVEAGELLMAERLEEPGEPAT